VPWEGASISAHRAPPVVRLSFFYRVRTRIGNHHRRSGVRRTCRAVLRRKTSFACARSADGIAIAQRAGFSFVHRSNARAASLSERCPLSGPGLSMLLCWRWSILGLKYRRTIARSYRMAGITNGPGAVDRTLKFVDAASDADFVVHGLIPGQKLGENKRHQITNCGEPNSLSPARDERAEKPERGVPNPKRPSLSPTLSSLWEEGRSSHPIAQSQ